MEFRIVLQHSMDGVRYITAVAKLYSIMVDDLKESEIIDNTNEVVGQVYILCCFGSVENFEKLKKITSVQK